MASNSARKTITETLKQAAQKLQPKKIVCDADRDLGYFEAEVLLAHTLRVDRSWLIAHANESAPPTKQKQFEKLVLRRSKHEPIAYILGERDFYGRAFFVNKNTLIPRPESELLIELAKEIAPNSSPIIWDVGTGSGALAITLAAEIRSSNVLATDINSRTISAAKKNAKQHAVTSRITFLKQNLLQPPSYRWLKKHGAKNPHLIIIANLPYLPLSDKKKLDLDVTKFEPSRALFSGADGLDLIRRFLGQLKRHATEWGYKKIDILFEYDPPQTKKLQTLVSQLFPEATSKIIKDLANRDRVLHLTLTP